MIGTSLPSTSLPKAITLTKALTSPSSPSISRDEFHQLRQAFEGELGTVTRSLPVNERIRIDGYRLRNTVSENADLDSPFRWLPWTARRPIGVECVRACLACARLTPLQASHDVIRRFVRRADDERGHPGSLAEWLAGLAVGGRTVVQAEAVVWATQLLTALDWTKLSRPIVGGDRSVVPSSSSRVLLRGRIEVLTRVVPARSPNKGEALGARDVGPAALFAMMTGRPSPTARTELGLAALTVALDGREGEAPIRVVGWWPQCGRALVVPVDLALFNQTCDAVLGAVRSACPPQRRQPRAAKDSVGGSGRRDAVRKPTRRAATRVAPDTERVAS
jgi:hypothetical protein